MSNARKINNFLIFKPFISRLFTHIILLYLTINNFILFKENREGYETFLHLMADSVITDIKFVNASEACPKDYHESNGTNFGYSYTGCICDETLMKTTQCKMYSHEASLPKCDIVDTEYVPGGNSTKSSQVRRRILSSSSSSDGHTVSTSAPTQKCNYCYVDLPGLTKNISLSIFYQNTKICIKKDEDITTADYLKSAGEHCDDSNVCNDYFCKKANDEKNPCPITTIASPDDQLKFGISNTNLTKPFGFSTDYEKYRLYDSNYHGIVSLPLTAIIIGRQGMCKNSISKSSPEYPLMQIETCDASSRYSTIDETYVEDLIQFNGMTSYISKALPWYFYFTEDSKWQLQGEYAFSKESIYCILNSKKLFYKNQFTVELNRKVTEDIPALKHNFTESIVVFTEIADNDKFQYGVQTYMLIVNIFITFLELLNVFFKFFKVKKNKNLRCCLNVFSYEGYLVFLIDISMLVVGIFTYTKLHHFSLEVEHLLATNCLDKYTSGLMKVYRTATAVVADKNLEIFLIIMTKKILIVLSIVYTCFTKKGKVPYSVAEEIIFEREVSEEHEEGNEHGHGRDGGPQGHTKNRVADVVVHSPEKSTQNVKR
jgi:hypothetical protein